MGQRLELSLTLANLPRSPLTSHLSPLTSHLSPHPAHHEGKGWSLRLHLPTCLLTSHLSPPNPPTSSLPFYEQVC